MTRSKWAVHGVAQVVDLERRVGGGGDALRLLAVEHPQRVVSKRPACSSHSSSRRLRGTRPALAVGGPALVVAERGEVEAQAGDAQVLVEAPRQGDHLDVDVGVVGAERLDADLVVLAVAAGLGPLVAEVGRAYQTFHGVVGPVLHEGPHHRRRALGPQRDVAAALVLEVVHLLADDVGALADPLEHADVLEHRPDDQPVSRPLHPPGEELHQPLIPRRLRRQDVKGPLGHPFGTPPPSGTPIGTRPDRVPEVARKLSPLFPGHGIEELRNLPRSQYGHVAGQAWGWRRQGSTTSSPGRWVAAAGSSGRHALRHGRV